MIRFACTCGRQLQADEGQVGSTAACPACGRVVTVPDAAHSMRHADPWYAADSATAASSIQREQAEITDDFDPEHPKTSGKALASMLVAFASVVAFLIIGAFAPPRVLYGAALANAILVGFAVLALRDINQARGRLKGDWMAWTGLGVGLCFLGANLVTTQIEKVRGHGSGFPSTENNLKLIGSALQGYHDSHGHFPPAASRGPDGKLLLSWRVAVLPYLEEDSLYKQFRLDEPWDSPHNKPLLSQMPREFAEPDQNPPGRMTRYQVYVGPGTAFEDPHGQMLKDFPDGANRTLLLVEGKDPVPWTKPLDLPFGPNVPIERPHNQGTDYCLVFAADGSIHRIPVNIAEKTLRALITRNGGETVDWP